MVYGLEKVRPEERAETAIAVEDCAEEAQLFSIASRVRPNGGREERRAAEALLVRLLLGRRMGTFSSAGNIPSEAVPYSGEMKLTADSLGRPVLLLDGRDGPAVSFTHLGRTTWAALAPRNCAIGIDAASRTEFSGTYPFHRAFHNDELAVVPAELAADIPAAAAAIWSVKEAAVKALGCGFWLADPFELHVSEWRAIRQGFESRVMLSGRAGQRFMPAELRPLRVCTFGGHEVRVSVALVARL